MYYKRRYTEAMLNKTQLHKYLNFYDTITKQCQLKEATLNDLLYVLLVIDEKYTNHPSK